MDPTLAQAEAPRAKAAGASLAGRPIGEILVAQGAVPQEKVAEALAAQAERGGRLGEVLISLKACSEEQVLKALAAQLELPYQMRLAPEEISPELVKLVPINFAKQARLMPLRIEVDGDARALVAIADPLDSSALDSVRLLLGASISPVLVPSQAILDCINSVYDRASNEAEQLVGDLEAGDLDMVAHELEEPQDLLDSSDEAPIIRLVNSLLFRAAKERASDIHIEPQEKDICVRFRVDGVLQEVIRPPKRFQNSIASRVKIMGGLNIAEKRLPQDGRIRVKLAGRDIDIRLSTTPTVFGERIVMRLLDKSAVLLDLAEIGMDKDQLAAMEGLIHKANGIVLVTGPTGSGKTTTLYAALSIINRPDLNIMTIEDPVEYQLQGISQTPVSPKIDLTFANGLRSFLRQDPDVIMVGEIRDRETAEIAIQASLTGHLVFSTVHTNDAAGAITRLIDMGVEAYLVGSSLIGVLAQRLVRVLCKECREAYLPTPEELKEIGLSTEKQKPREPRMIYRPKGCDACNGTGYRGRTGIYEIMMVDDAIRELAVKKVDSGSIKRAAVQKGMRTLMEDGGRKVLRGITSVAEVLSVTQEDLA
ncbi:MAG TPA: type II secretion system ATPase GspE [Myxococcales bacterium]|jgi:general secretion pathway protein E|nr:type II secretion system ATPase GspE [Myxococcales bacterium]